MKSYEKSENHTIQPAGYIRCRDRRSSSGIKVWMDYDRTADKRTGEKVGGILPYFQSSLPEFGNSSRRTEFQNLWDRGRGRSDRSLYLHCDSFRSDSLWSKGHFRRQPEGFYGDGLRKGGRGHYIQNESDCCG